MVSPFASPFSSGLEELRERFIENVMVVTLEKLPMPWLEDDKAAAAKCASVALAMWVAYVEAINTEAIKS